MKHQSVERQPVVGEDWNTMLDGFYGLIDQYANVFREALQKKK